MNYHKREKYKGNIKIGPWFNFENLKDVYQMVQMVGLSQILIFSFLTIPGLCVSIITKYTNKRGTVSNLYRYECPHFKGCDKMPGSRARSQID